MITASPLRPSRIERESHVRCEATVMTDDVDPGTPYFAFATWYARPTQWRAGEWRQAGNQRIAQSPVVGQSPNVLAPGVWFPYLKVDGEVVSLGRLRVV
jgi:hypothetical protein